MKIFPVNKKLNPSSFSINVVANNQINVSPLTNSVEVAALFGDFWEINASWTNVEELEADELVSFFESLGGQRESFTMYPFHRPTPKGTSLGTPLVDGTGQIGTSINTKGWDANQSEVLKAGDFFQIGDELKKITATTSSDASGNAVLEFIPPLRRETIDSANITINYPRGTFRLTTPKLDTSITTPILYALSITAREFF
jgi:hypothetical protein